MSRHGTPEASPLHKGVVCFNALHKGAALNASGGLFCRYDPAKMKLDTRYNACWPFDSV